MSSPAKWPGTRRGPLLSSASWSLLCPPCWPDCAMLNLALGFPKRALHTFTATWQWERSGPSSRDGTLFCRMWLVSSSLQFCLLNSNHPVDLSFSSFPQGRPAWLGLGALRLTTWSSKRSLASLKPLWPWKCLEESWQSTLTCLPSFLSCCSPVSQQSLAHRLH